ncbi:MAG: helix-turn-helix transcriptional regulator, partial [Candidatus Ornithospirochaeta sp.]|nr:helix-turn-helix transcriptional regulator [Candidatus Ornithospirochaeta sp.]
CKQRFYGREFMMEEGDALIIAPRTYHSISVFEDDTVTINLLVKMETLKDVLAFESKEKKGLRSFFEALRNEDVTRTCVLIRHSDEALRMLPYLEDQSYRPLFLSQLAMYFALLFKGDEYTFPITPTENNDRLTSILESIRNNPKDATLTTIADEYGLSPGYLSAMIHEKTGLTFSSLVAKRKVQIATKLLLQDENASNIAIAERIGMNPQQFCRFFRKWLGMTPKEYRERNRKKPIQDS